MRLSGQTHRLLFAAALALIALRPIAAPASPQPLQHLRALSHHARVTALVVRLRDMHTIAAIQPDQRLRPASVSKLFAASAALSQFGPAHRFTSRFTTAGTLHDGALRGNLVFRGGGDPSLDNRALRTLVTRLKSRGIRRVNGDLVVDESLWGHVPCLTHDRCAAHERASHAYSAPLSAAGVNFGTLAATVYPGSEAGRPARAILNPAGLSGYAIDNRVRTRSSGAAPHIRAWRTYDGATSTLHLRGSLPAGGDPYRLHRAAAGAATETAHVLAALLKQAGIALTGVLRTRAAATTDAGETVLASVDSPSLAAQLIPMMAYSNNYMADTLTLDTAAADGDTPPLSLPRAAQTLESLSAVANQSSYPGRHTGHAILDSGSGLSLGNRISARDLVSLLTYMFHQTALFPSFYGSLPVPAFSPYHTLKQGNTAFETRLVAKTGTLTQPVTVRALAGYIRLADGGFAAYGLIINGTSSHPDLTERQTVHAYEQDLESLLADH